MNLFSRVKHTVVADFHELLDQKEQNNPIKMLNEFLRQCEVETEKVGKLIQRQSLLKDKLSGEYEEANRLLEKRKEQAGIAGRAGESALEAIAIQEANIYEARTVYLKEILLKTEEQLEELKNKYQEMKHKLKDMGIKRLELMGRENTAKANQRINQVLNASIDSKEPVIKVEEMEHYLNRLENGDQSAANGSDTLDDRIIKLQKEMEIKETHSIS